MDQENNTSATVWRVLWAIILLVPLNFIFVLIPLFIATSIIIMSWKLVLWICISWPVIFILSMFGAIHVGFHFFALFAILFFIIGWAALMVAILYGIVFITYFYFKGIIKLLTWNVHFVKNRC
jgi:uncharacterized membrane protein